MTAVPSEVGLRYETADVALAAALPELQPCIDRLVLDWDDFDGAPPGQYMVFDTYEVWVEVLVGLADHGIEAGDRLRRAFDLAEQMLTGEDRELRYLAIDACAEVLCGLPGSREIVEQIGGPALRGWMAEYCNGDGRPPEREIIDLWGVREELAACLPHIPLEALPGITQPADHHRLDSFAEAGASADGVILLHPGNKSGMFVLARPCLVQCGEAALKALAVELAPVPHYNAITGAQATPGVAYFDIPTNERVWNMTLETEPHARLTLDIDLWVAPALSERQREIRQRLARPDLP